MRAGDHTRRDTIRLARNAIRNAEIARQGRLSDQALKGAKAVEGLSEQEVADLERQAKLDEQGVIEVLSKEVKQRRESIVEFRKGGREDLVQKEEAEMAVLQAYLPQQLSREEIAAQARKVIQDVGARGPADKGKVMSKLMPLMRGKADGRDVNEVVAELLG